MVRKCEGSCCQGDIADIKAVQFRNGWGKSANGFFAEIIYLCKGCRNQNKGAFRLVKPATNE